MDFEQIDELFCNGEFSKVDEYMGSLDPYVNNVEDIITILVASLCARKELRNRDLLYRKALSCYRISRPDEWEGLLVGLG